MYILTFDTFAATFERFDVHFNAAFASPLIFRQVTTSDNKNSSGDEIANVNFFYNIAHVEASAYAH